MPAATVPEESIVGERLEQRLHPEGRYHKHITLAQSSHIVAHFRCYCYKCIIMQQHVFIQWHYE